VTITSYHRPVTLDEALALLSRPETVVLAGGTSLNAAPTGSPRAAVDLQDLALDGIEQQDDAVRIGATTNLDAVARSPLVPPVLRNLARREAPSTIRNAATLGGTIATADPESELLAGLLAFGTTVTLARPGSRTEESLDDLLDGGIPRGSIVTSATVPAAGRAAAERTGRTPMDRPIVAAVAYQDGDLRLALAGVAKRPVLVDPGNLAGLEPPPDFRGSTAYRRHLAEVLAGRVLDAVAGGDGA
jgi:probable selenate reductase FAD-binding subunit